MDSANAIDFAYVQGSLVEIRRAVQGGPDGCRHALQVLHALKAYLNAKARTQIATAERVLLQRLVADVRHEAQTRPDEHNMLLTVLGDLERLTVGDSRDRGDMDDARDGGDGGDAADLMTWRATESEDASLPLSMDIESSSSAQTVVCRACGNVILARRMDAHLQFWCAPE